MGTVITIWGQQGHININKGYKYNFNGVVTSIIGTQHNMLLSDGQFEDRFEHKFEDRHGRFEDRFDKFSTRNTY